jgi:hypothetical protein
MATYPHRALVLLRQARDELGGHSVQERGEDGPAERVLIRGTAANADSHTRS